MGKVTGFMEFDRIEEGYAPVAERLKNYKEFVIALEDTQARQQGARCMDCGTPFCNSGCPVNNIIPDFNDLVYHQDWKNAFAVLNSTNNFPEFTGRICPALCEKSCVLKLSMDSPVTIRENEAAIAEAAFREGYIKPRNIERNGRKVAIIGAGPAGLAAANQLNGKGYTVTVFDKNEAPGGLLRYGIPNFKLHKPIIDRRIRVMEEEGIHFKMNNDVDVRQLPEGFDAYCICTGAPTARDLPVPGRELKGIHPALDMLAQQNRILAGMTFPKEQLVTAKGKKVLVIGGGDTGSDCIGTSNRQGAVSVTQIEIMPQPPVGQNPATPWPQFPVVLKTTSSHEEGCSRLWSLATRKFLGKNGKVCGVEVEPVEWTPSPDGGRPVMKPTGKVEVIEADLVLLAMGFLKPEHPQFAENVFVAGDAASGASLVVRAIASGRKAATDIDSYLNK